MEKTNVIRLGFFFGVFVCIAIWELVLPRRVASTSTVARWTNNLALTFMNPLMVHLLLPILAVGLAVVASEKGWGLLNNYDMPHWWAMALGIVALDFIIYLQHVMFHAVPVLWRLHMVHHADLDFDVTTGLRFHPIEILLSMGIKLAMPKPSNGAARDCFPLSTIFLIFSRLRRDSWILKTLMGTIWHKRYGRQTQGLPARDLTPRLGPTVQFAPPSCRCQPPTEA
jgi:hypothetical protein